MSSRTQSRAWGSVGEIREYGLPYYVLCTHDRVVWSARELCCPYTECGVRVVAAPRAGAGLWYVPQCGLYLERTNSVRQYGVNVVGFGFVAGRRVLGNVDHVSKPPNFSSRSISPDSAASSRRWLCRYSCSGRRVCPRVVRVHTAPRRGSPWSCQVASSPAVAFAPAVLRHRGRSLSL